MLPISVCILTKNASATIAECLEALTAFSQVLLLDNGSQDKTIEIAKKYPNVEIHTSPFLGFGPLRNLAASLARHDWILGIDSDEVLSSPLLREIQSLNLDSEKIYSIPRHNFFRGKWIRGAGWHPDRVLRLYHRAATSYTGQVHESLRKEGVAIHFLHSPIFHTPYRSISDFLVKMELYSTLFAEEHRGKRKSSLAKAIGHSLFTFCKNYFFQRGYRAGSEGFIISLYNAHTAFYKYIKLSE
ncbi:MAG: glycosyltransferase family 2 protein [Verrucomicrobiota bacterium]|nr:glycosyltransferase family 2 protein [Verrucomicrobiota bacterium]